MSILGFAALIVMLVFIYKKTPLGGFLRNKYDQIKTAKPTRKPVNVTMDDVYRINKANQMKELNALLDKIQRSGIDALSPKEKQRLDELSNL